MSQNVTPFLGLHINSPLATESESVGQPVNAWETDLNFEILDTAIQQLSQGGGGGAPSMRVVKKSASISAITISGGIATFTCKNSFVAGESVDIFNLAPDTSGLEDSTVTVLSSGLSATQFQAAVSVGDSGPTVQLAGDAAVNAYTFKQADAGNMFYFGDDYQNISITLDASVLTAPWFVTLVNTGKTSKAIITPVAPALMYAGPNSRGFASSNSSSPQPDFTEFEVGTWQSAQLVFDGVNFVIVPVVAAPASGYANFAINAGDIVSAGGEDFYFDAGGSRTSLPFGIALNHAEDNGTVLVQVSGAAWVQVDDPTGISAAMAAGRCPLAANGAGVVLAQPGDYILGWGIVYDGNFSGQICVAISPSKLPLLPATTAATPHQFVTSYNATTGAFAKAQPVVADVTGAEATANKGVAGGYASLDGTGKVPAGQLPAPAVTSVFGRTGDVVAGSNDYAAVTTGVTFGNGNEYIQFPANGAGDYIFCTTSLGTYLIFDESALPEFHAQAGSVGAAIDLHSGAMQLTTPTGTTLDFNGASLQADGFTLTDDSGNIEVSGGHANGGLFLLAAGTGDKINLAANAGVSFGATTKLLDGTGAAGTNGQVLSSTGAAIKWITLPAGFANPMVAHGDIIYENASLGPAALPIGTTGQHLTVVGAQPAWTTVVMPNTAVAVTHQFLNSYDATTGNFGQAQPAAADITGLAAIATSGKWSDLQNATAALTLANGTNGTTFNQTSAVTWLLANTTAATAAGSAAALVSSQMISTGGSGAQANGSAINTTGATLLVVALQGASGIPTVSDGQGNTWNYTNPILSQDGFMWMRTAYAFSKAGGALATSASHTFTVASTGSSAIGGVYAFSGTKTDASVLDTWQADGYQQSQPSVLPLGFPAAGDVAVVGVYNRQNLTTYSFPAPAGATGVFSGATQVAGTAAFVGLNGLPFSPTFGGNNSFATAGQWTAFKTALAVTPQNSPILSIAGTYWNGAASAADTWSLQDVLTANTNGPSTLAITHSGSTGPAAVQVPGLTIIGTSALINSGTLDLHLKNGTAATSTTVANSPALALGANFFNFGASQEDAWTIQNQITPPHLSATVTNFAETAASACTMTITGGNFTVSATAGNDWVTFTGLTTATWLNGVTVQLITASATSLTFTDPTAHGLVNSTSETGQVTQANPFSILMFEHTGSEQHQIQFSVHNAQTWNFTYPLFAMANAGQAFGLPQQNGFSPGPSLGVGIDIYASGSASPLRWYGAGVQYGHLSGQTTALTFGLVSDPVGSVAFINGNKTTQTNSPAVSFGNSNNSNFTATSGTQVGASAGSEEIIGGNFSSHLVFAPTSGNANFVAFRTNPNINQTAAISNTVVGSALVANVGAVVFSTANAYGAGVQLLLALGTNTALNGYQTLSTQGQRAGSPYTITNSVENSSSVVTLTLGTHNVAANDWIFITGLTTATWLNGQTVKVTSVVANSTITFTDLSSHGTKVTGVDTGTVTDNFVTFSLTHANITGSADTGTVVQQGVGNYTAILANVLETSAQGPANLLLDLQAGANTAGAANTSYASISSRGTLKTAGGRIVNRVSKAGSYTSTAIDYVIVFTATATLTLDSAVAVAGTMYRVKLSTSAAGGSALTLSPNNSKTIDGAATLVINTLGGAVDVVYDGAGNWEIF